MRTYDNPADAATAVCDAFVPSPYTPTRPPVAVWRHRTGTYTVGRYTEGEPSGAQLLGVLSAPTTPEHITRLTLARAQ